MTKFKAIIYSNGGVRHPVDTDDIILKICNDKLNLGITLSDIGRSHVVGKVKDGKTQVIVRFISYRTCARVYSAKKILRETQKKYLSQKI